MMEVKNGHLADATVVPVWCGGDGAYFCVNLFCALQQQEVKCHR